MQKFLDSLKRDVGSRGFLWFAMGLFMAGATLLFVPYDWLGVARGCLLAVGFLGFLGFGMCTKEYVPGPSNPYDGTNIS